MAVQLSTVLEEEMKKLLTEVQVLILSNQEVPNEKMNLIKTLMNIKTGQIAGHTLMPPQQCTNIIGGFPILNFFQSSQLMQSSYIPPLTAPSTSTALPLLPFYPNPILGSNFTTPLFIPFVGFKSRFEEAVAHTRVCKIYTQREVVDTNYKYLFDPHGSQDLPQTVEKSSPTTRTLFKRWMEKHKCSAGDIEQRWEHMDETARREWEHLARWLRRERKNQLEKKYIYWTVR
ncbi:unnamed protein product [Caenorhabditis brenneri]